MAALRERISDDLKTAMKAGEKAKVSTLRLVSAALKDKDIELRGVGKGPASDDEVLAMMQKMVKQREESITIYEANGRPELAAGERGEIEVITGYMPAQLGEAEVAAAIADAITSTGAASMKDMGKVVAKLRVDHAGRMDFGRASALVKAKLSGG